jgi:hypothetical protein
MTISVMLTAKQARAKTLNDLIIFNEVRDIEEAILRAASEGEFSSVVLTGTMMTGLIADTGSTESLDAFVTTPRFELAANDGASSQVYYNIWQGTMSHRAKEVQMNTVVQYFTDLGYQIERRTNATTGYTFKWVVYW